MNYYELAFKVSATEDYHQDLLINYLSEIGFDTFEETENGFNAYIKEEDYYKEAIDSVIEELASMFEFSYEANFVPQKNWNEVWESNFEPISIDDKVHIRATFHPSTIGFDYEIVIDPKMSFGTGHHQTTVLMLNWILESDIKDKVVLDMGCGTAILAILASKMGALTVDAIDYDDVCYDSAIENAALNNITNLTAYLGSKEAIPAKEYEVILANINRNILLDQIETYAKVLKSGGSMFLSGFYETPDLEILIEEAKKHGLKYIHHKKMDEWVSAKFIK